MNAAQTAAPLPALPSAEETPSSHYEKKGAEGKGQRRARLRGGRSQETERSWIQQAAKHDPRLIKPLKFLYSLPNHTCLKPHCTAKYGSSC